MRGTLVVKGLKLFFCHQSINYCWSVCLVIYANRKKIHAYAKFLSFKKWLSFLILYVTYLKKSQNIFIYMETTSKLSFLEIDSTIFITTECNWQKQPLAQVFYGCFCHLEKQPAEVFYKKGVLTNFANFTGKHLGQSLF